MSEPVESPTVTITEQPNRWRWIVRALIALAVAATAVSLSIALVGSVDRANHLRDRLDRFTDRQDCRNRLASSNADAQAAWQTAFGVLLVDLTEPPPHDLADAIAAIDRATKGLQASAATRSHFEDNPDESCPISPPP